MRGGARRGAGRKRKATALRSRLTADPAANDGKVMPLDLLLTIMRDPAVSMAERADMAKACLPYCHARLPQLQKSDHSPDYVPPHERLAEYTRLAKVTHDSTVNGED